jgi:hypothetical protein
MGVHLMGVHLMGVHLIGVHLIGVHLIGVHLMGVCLMGALLIVATVRMWEIRNDFQNFGVLSLSVHMSCRTTAIESPPGHSLHPCHSLDCASRDAGRFDTRMDPVAHPATTISDLALEA